MSSISQFRKEVCFKSRRCAEGHRRQPTRILQSEPQPQVPEESEEEPGRTSSCLLNHHRGLTKYKDGDSTGLSRPDHELVSVKGLPVLKKWTFKDVSFIPR